MKMKENPKFTLTESSKFKMTLAAIGLTAALGAGAAINANQDPTVHVKPGIGNATLPMAELPTEIPDSTTTETTDTAEETPEETTTTTIEQMAVVIPNENDIKTTIVPNEDNSDTVNKEETPVSIAPNDDGSDRSYRGESSGQGDGQQEPTPSNNEG